MKQTGMFWHEHHDILLEHCYDYIGRVRFIKEVKPSHEIEQRLKVFKPVKGKLPQEVIEAGKVYSKARKTRDKAWETRDKTWEVYSKASWKTRYKAWKAYDKEGKACDKAWEAYDKAWEAYDKAIKKYKVAIEALHKKECPNCTWNGKELVFKKGD